VTILADIIAYKITEIAHAKMRLPLASLEPLARETPHPRGFSAALKRARRTRHAIIAEIKKASPSRGLIRSDFDPPSLARAYAAGGAACLSVLTDAPSFEGSPEHLQKARAAVDLPILRKDFMIDPYQAVEARAWGADCILLIMACLSDSQTQELKSAAGDWGLDVLVETHDEKEVDRALRLGVDLIGINNRNLKTFETDLRVTEQMALRIPPGPLIVSESGINSRADVERLARAGAHAFLVGESLMRAGDIEAATKALSGGGVNG
jgi:indole-3-glycerol phosphate synthase